MIGRGDDHALVAQTLAIAVATTVALAIAPVAHGTAGQSRSKPRQRTIRTAMPRYEASLVTVINYIRLHYGLSRLELAPMLASAARNQSLHMARKGCLSHSPPCSASFSIRIKGFFAGGPSSYFGAGETLFWARAGITPTSVVRHWLASPPHRSVLLSSQWQAVGIGVVHTIHAPGIFGGRNVVVVTADFAVKR